MATTLRTKLDSRRDVGDDQVELRFVPDYDDDRNQEWAKYTPALQLSMVVRSDAGAAGFTVGTAYEITIDETPDDGSADGGTDPASADAPSH